MSIVARIIFSSKLKNSASEIGYYSYTEPLWVIDQKQKIYEFNKMV